MEQLEGYHAININTKDQRFMKNIILKIITITLFALCFHLKAQTDTIAVQNYGVEYDLAQGIDYRARDYRYYKDINGTLNPFIGIWKNTIGNKTFKVTLWKKEMDNFKGFYLDGIYGDYVVIENEGQVNQVILFDSKLSHGTYTPTMFLYGRYPIISGSLVDNSRFESMKTIDQMVVSFEINAGNITARWRAKIMQGIRGDNYISPYIPTDIILTKQ